jgi:hypothetical protein
MQVRCAKGGFVRKGAEVAGMSYAEGGGRPREEQRGAESRGAFRGRMRAGGGGLPGGGTVSGHHVEPLGTGGFLCGRGD